MNAQHRPITIACAAVLAAGCMSSPSQRTYIAPTQQTVLTAIEQMTSAPGQVIYVENRSSVPVTVYSVMLRDCENVKTGCSGPRPLNLRLKPGTRAMLVRVEPVDAHKAFNFRYTFGWRADSSTTAAFGALAAEGDSSAQRQLDAIALEDARRRAAVGAMDLELTASEVAGLGDRAHSLRALPDAIVIPVGRRLGLDTVRVFLIGMEGETLGRIRAFQWRVLESSVVAAVRPDSVVGVAPGRTLLQLKLSDDVLPMKPMLHAPLEVPIVVRE